MRFLYFFLKDSALSRPTMPVELLLGGLLLERTIASGGIWGGLMSSFGCVDFDSTARGDPLVGFICSSLLNDLDSAGIIGVDEWASYPSMASSTTLTMMEFFSSGWNVCGMVMHMPSSVNAV